MSKTKPSSLVIVDDHKLLASSLEKLINSFPNFNVLYHVGNGAELQHQLEAHAEIPDIILLDVNMPIMNGYETLTWLTANYPSIKVLALSMDDDEDVILKMLRRGAKGYLLKDIHPDKLEEALIEVVKNGYYHSEKVASTLLQSLHTEREEEQPEFKEKEITFMKLASTEMTYKEIAKEMNLSPKTVDGYRQDVFNKLKVRNRIGMVIYALKHKYVEL
ncbi:MAG: DNA-binding response regulator [Flavobacteriaceae bacterium]|nr:DNA-binding response regulator [Flavobacteriaceae bacterium]